MQRDGSELPDSPEEDFKALPEDYYEVQRMSKVIEAERKTAARSLEELKSEMLSLIELRYDGAAPAGVRLAELNRRFGVAAHRMGSSSRDLILELLNGGHLLAYKHRDSTVVVAKAKHRERMALFSGADGYVDTQLIEAEEREILARSFPAPSDARKRTAPKKLPLW